MSIKDKLTEELAKASKEEDKKDLEQKAHEQEALELFKPITEALNELSNELSDIDGINIRVTQNHVRVKLGDVTTLESYRYFFFKELTVDEKNQWGYPSYDVMERTHKFDTSEQVIDFFVKKCAEYVASLKKD